METGYVDYHGLFVEGHGDDAIVHGSGGGVDRIIQSATKTGWVTPERMRPMSFTASPAQWDELCIRKTVEWEAQVARSVGSQCTSIQLASSNNGTGAVAWRRARVGRQ